MEATIAVLFVACLETFGAHAHALIAALFGSLLVALAAIDLEHYLLPDLITLPGLAVGLLLAVAGLWIPWRDAVLGALLGGGGLWLLSRAWLLLRGEEGPRWRRESARVTTRKPAAGIRRPDPQPGTRARRPSAFMVSPNLKE